jgi:putative spermidine/putrescine transport system ATP-binding protein
MTVVYVTHDQEEAMNMSDCIAIMDRGRIKQMDSARRVYEDPHCQFVAQFLGEANLVSSELISGQESHKGMSLFIRPERVRLAPADTAIPADAIRLEGVVRRASFLGNTVRYTVEIGRNCHVTADTPNSGESPQFAAEEHVSVYWRAADSKLLPDA